MSAKKAQNVEVDSKAKVEASTNRENKKDEVLQSENERDCTKFNIRQRAKDLFEALDDDESGGITMDEFVDGCMLDAEFVKLLEDFDGDQIWGKSQKNRKKSTGKN